MRSLTPLHVRPTGHTAPAAAAAARAANELFHGKVHGADPHCRRALPSRTVRRRPRSPTTTIQASLDVLQLLHLRPPPSPPPVFNGSARTCHLKGRALDSTGFERILSHAIHSSGHRYASVLQTDTPLNRPTHVLHHCRSLTAAACYQKTAHI